MDAKRDRPKARSSDRSSYLISRSCLRRSDKCPNTYPSCGTAFYRGFAYKKNGNSYSFDRSLLAGFEDDPEKLWESNIFGKSLHELVNEGLQNKLLHMPQEARTRLQETLERVINEGCTGLICILI